MLISFIARALAVTDIFCYQSVASAGIVLLLPGYIIRSSRCFLSSSSAGPWLTRFF